MHAGEGGAVVATVRATAATSFKATVGMRCSSSPLPTTFPSSFFPLLVVNLADDATPRLTRPSPVFRATRREIQLSLLTPQTRWKRLKRRRSCRSARRWRRRLSRWACFCRARVARGCRRSGGGLGRLWCRAHQVRRARNRHYLCGGCRGGQGDRRVPLFVGGTAAHMSLADGNGASGDAVVADMVHITVVAGVLHGPEAES